MIITDNTKTIWINALSGNTVCNADGTPIVKVINVKKFQDGSSSKEETADLESLFDLIEASLDVANDRLKAVTLLDPTPLAKALWQKIWVNTGKEPEKCLYNVVEMFVFKFLSDLGVLKAHMNFDAIYKIREQNADDALSQYAAVVRKQIRGLFPAGDDGTTIINGTIFVNEKGEANHAQSHLFGEVLDELYRYGKAYGSFRHIQREFKTKLYEAFLRQSAGVKALGQFFTPRTVVQAIVKMSTAGSLPPTARICDPFCGVGGFILEAIAEVPGWLAEFEPKNGKVAPRLTLRGYDKGSDEKEDERTIILAKANMLIYFADLIAKHHTPSELKQFSQNAFNPVFTLLRSNLGTFEKIDEEPFDLILTNPPYVSSGVASLRRAIESAGLGSYYTSGGRGTEALSIEWIVKNLTPGGQGIAVVPDGLLQQEAILRYICAHCEVQAIISLPEKTFYSTKKKTYILAFTKKKVSTADQKTPIFSYIVSEIGESRDSYRFPSSQNDLTEAAALFNQFKGSPESFKAKSSRCKIIPVSKILKADHWLCERWWSNAERQKLGVVDAVKIVSPGDLASLAIAVQASAKILAAYQPITSSISSKVKVNKLRLGGSWMEYIKTKTGWNKTQYRQYDTQDSKDIPVYSAAKLPVAYIHDSSLGIIDATAKAPVISFAANGDGSAGTNLLLHVRPFFVSTDRTCFRVIDSNIDPEFIFYGLHGMKQKHGFNHTFKATPDNLRAVELDVPISGKTPDLVAQRAKVKSFKTVHDAKIALEEQLRILSATRLTFD
ncbi:N-6 DNA methylase [Collimonas antrihumi]|uniref:N-6 DNA methylase n=1 Tax=Collimonas antrihumi TaxID=1940615 RepID=UPI001B8BBDF9|nr:N-6 DNA methylase [Collimonas antrihumi]